MQSHTTKTMFYAKCMFCLTARGPKVTPLTYNISEYHEEFRKALPFALFCMLNVTLLIFNKLTYINVPTHNTSPHIKLVWLLTSSLTLSSVRASCCCKSSSISANWLLVSSSVLLTSKSKRHSLNFLEPNDNLKGFLQKAVWNNRSWMY